VAESDWAILNGLSAEDRARVVANASERRLARGEYVFRHGDQAHALFVIATGWIAIELDTQKGERVTLHVLGRGDCFGELALLNEASGRRSASAVALEQSVLHQLDRHQFDQLRRNHPSMQLMLLGVLHQQVTRLTAHLVDTLTEDARTKVLRTLCRLADVFDVAGGNHIQVSLDRVKTMAGVTRRVTDIFRDLEVKGLIRREGRHAIVIPDLSALRHEAGLTR
jgi:CRP-like cAMP-binding protein